MSRPRVLQMREFTADVEAALDTHFEMLRPAPESPDGSASDSVSVARCDGLCPTVVDTVDAELITRAGSRLKIIANFGVGYDNIDLEAAKSAGVVVTNTPDVLTDATADLAMTLLLMCARRAGEGERLCRAGVWTGWEPTQLLGTGISGKTLGLVGFGRIGAAVAGRARRGFDMKILVHSHRPIEPVLLSRYDASECPDLDDMLAQCDFVSLHCPGSDATRHLIDAGALAAMPETAILINTARGPIVDEKALIAALASRRIAAAGLDVYEREPEIPDELRALENVTLLPHLGSATRETRSAMGMRVLANLVDYFDGREPRDRVA